MVFRLFSQYSPILSILKCATVQGMVFKPGLFVISALYMLAIRVCAAVQSMVLRPFGRYSLYWTYRYAARCSGYVFQTFWSILPSIGCTAMCRCSGYGFRAFW